MYLYFNKQGILTTKLIHGEPVRQGSYLNLYVLLDEDFFDDIIPGTEPEIYCQFVFPNGATLDTQDAPNMTSPFMNKNPQKDYIFQKTDDSEVTFDLIEGKKYIRYGWRYTPEQATYLCGILTACISIHKYTRDDENRLQTTDINYFGKAEINVEETLGNKRKKYDVTEAYYEKINKLLKEFEAGQITIEDLVYNNESPTTTALGGISKGETFDNVPLNEMFNKLLYPYVAFNISSVASVPNGGVYEVGKTASVTGFTVNVALGSVPLKYIKIYDGTNLICSKTENLSNSNSLSYQEIVDSNKNYRVEVADTTDNVKSSTTSLFNFVYPYYYGPIAYSATLTESLIKGLTKLVTAKANKTLSFNMTLEKGCACLAYPSSYGNLRKIEDVNKFNVTETFTKNVISINSVSYNVYVLNNSNNTTMSYTFSF